MTNQETFTITAPTGTDTSDGIGYGVSSVFYLVVGLMEEAEDTIVCIDEPETSMQPASAAPGCELP